MVIAGGFVTNREHAFDDLYRTCARCGVTRGQIMDGLADWECVALDNVVSLDAARRAKLKRKK